MFPELGAVACNSLPFEHFTGQAKLPRACNEWLDWFETEAPWKLTTD